MAHFGIYEIVQCTGGKLFQGNLRSRLRGVSTNSKTVKKGELFVAIVGKKHNAHRFIPEAVKNGATAILVSQDYRDDTATLAVIKVQDTTKALGDIARFHRLRFSIPVIAITGSAGKTTAKEMIAAVLKGKYKILKNIGTENNQFGIPLTILKLKPRDEIAVLEVGTNSPGDIAWLASIVRPTVVVMTNIGESHLELLKTTAAVFKEKFNLVKSLPKDGVVIVNQDDVYLEKMRQLVGKKQKVYTFGVNAKGVRHKADFQAKEIKSSGQKIAFHLAGAGRITVPGIGITNVYNALSAICCGRLFKIGYNDIKKSLKNFSFKAGRQTLVKVGGMWLIDDTYNANPVSFRNALDAVKLYPTRGRRVLLCGDMLELGKHSESLHQQMGERAARCGLNMILSFGKFSQLVGTAAQRMNSGITIFHGTTAEEVEGRIKEYLRSDDMILIKGSRGMRMERFVEFVKKNFSASPARRGGQTEKTKR